MDEPQEGNGRSSARGSFSIHSMISTVFYLQFCVLFSTCHGTFSSVSGPGLYLCGSSGQPCAQMKLGELDLRAFRLFSSVCLVLGYIWWT